ncbi:MAG: DNA repair protein RecO (recombination protein O) [Candidatus Krumholzibacteriia bacterium]|jgi:DNA repair protein RecO (recombination protein O)
MGILPQPSASCDALVLRVWPCGETSVIASLLTCDYGYVKVIAKAARRPKSRLRALVEPGRLVNVEFSLNEKRELQYLRGGTVEWDSLGPGTTLEQTAFLQAALELADRCRPLGNHAGDDNSNEAASQLFRICDHFLRVLSSPSCVRSDLAFFAFEWQLLAAHGMAPEVDLCTSCGQNCDDLTEDSLWFSPSEGGVVCGACARKPGASTGKPLGSTVWGIFTLMASGELSLDADSPLERPLRRELGAHLHNFLGYHLPGYRLPAALDLLRARKEQSG